MAINDINVVSDPFWLNMGAELVYNSAQARKDAVDRLQKTIAWVFGIYTSISIGSLVFVKKEDWNAVSLLLFGLAFLFLIIAYWIATISAFPAPESFYGSEAASIREAYLIAIKKTKRSFKSATILCSIGVFLYSIALLNQFGSPVISKYFGSKTSNTQDSLHIELRNINKEKNIYAFQIDSKKNSWINLTLKGDTTKEGTQKMESDIFILNNTPQNSIWLRTDSSASIHLSFQLIRKPNIAYYFIASRTDTLSTNNVLKTIQQKVDLK